jgi:outer membrane protein TolC
MLFRTATVRLVIIVGMMAPPALCAEVLKLELSNAITLSSLTDKVYQQHPAHDNGLAQQQLINANSSLANARFADAPNINLLHQNDIVGSDDGLQEWIGSVDLSIWLPGQKKQQLSLSDKMAAELPAYEQQIRLDASATVRELIWNAVLANNATTQAYQVWQSAQKLEQDVAARVKAGELAGTALLLADTNVLDMHSQYLLTQAELEIALKNYRYYTGENALPQHYEELLSDLNNSVISQQHPSLMIMEQQINTLRTKQDIAHFEGVSNPILSVGVKSERSIRGEHFNNSVGVGVSFSFDDSVYRQPAIANAAKELADVEITRQQLERKLNIILFSQLHDLETKQQQLELVKEQNITTQQYLALQQRAFDLGEIDLVSLLRSQSLANASTNRKLALEIDIKHAVAKVNQALGVTL